MLSVPLTDSLVRRRVFFVARQPGGDRRVAGSQRKDLLMSVRTHALGVQGSMESAAVPGDPAPSNVKYPTYQSKMSLAFIYSSLFCISSRSRICLDKQAD